MMRAATKSASWEQEAERLSGDEMARLRWKVLSRFGILPTEKRAKRLRDRDVLLCALHMLLDGEERLDSLCPACQTALVDPKCPRCGQEQGEENPAFDLLRFEELKNRG